MYFLLYMAMLFDRYPLVQRITMCLKTLAGSMLQGDGLTFSCSSLKLFNLYFWNKRWCSDDSVPGHSFDLTLRGLFWIQVVQLSRNVHSWGRLGTHLQPSNENGGRVTCCFVLTLYFLFNCCSRPQEGVRPCLGSQLALSFQASQRPSQVMHLAQSSFSSSLAHSLPGMAALASSSSPLDLHLALSICSWFTRLLT